MSERITKLKAKRVETLDKIDALLAAGSDENRELTEDEQKTLTSLRADDDRLASAIQVEEDLLKRKAAAAVPVPSLPGAGAPATVPAAPARPLQPGIQFSRITQALIHGNMDRRAAADWAERTWGTESGQIVANLEESTNEKGGFLVDEAYSSDFIDVLRPKVTVRAMGARTVPMPAGNLTTRRKTGTSQAAYVGERQNISLTGNTFDQMNLSAKRLAAIVPVSNPLLRHSSQQVDAMVRDDLVEGVSVTEDQQFLRGTGSATAPAGLLNLADAGNKFAASDLSTAANRAELLQMVRGDLGALRLKLREANIPMVQPGYIVSPQIAEFLEQLTDANGNRAFPEVQDGRIGRYPFMDSTSVPNNLGTGTNESEIYFADFAQVVIGESLAVTIAASDVAAYHDGVEMRSAFQSDETLIRIIEEHDIDLRYAKAVAVLEEVIWELQ